MFPGGGGRCTGERRCKAKQGRHSKTALTYESCLYNSTDFAPRTRGVKDLFGNAHLKVISSPKLFPLSPKLFPLSPKLFFPETFLSPKLFAKKTIAEPVDNLRGD